jgi:tRNA U34 5-carboxymethylaminomethyl modifying enzyme MnmG/GidA
MEYREKLAACRPQTLAAASRIPGMTPEVLVALLRYATKYNTMVNNNAG